MPPKLLQAMVCVVLVDGANGHGYVPRSLRRGDGDDSTVHEARRVAALRLPSFDKAFQRIIVQARGELREFARFRRIEPNGARPKAPNRRHRRAYVTRLSRHDRRGQLSFSAPAAYS